MNPRAHVSLIYRFDNLEQVKAHVRLDGDRRFFFYRDPLLRLPAGTKVTIEWNIATGDATRLLQGSVQSSVEDCGVWIELLDARPLRDLGPSPYTRRSRRMATNIEIEIEGQPSMARMLDLSQRGARLTGVVGAARGVQLRLGVPSPEGAVEPLGVAIVTWCDGGECGVRFERRDPLGTNAVALLVKEIKEGWARAWHATHPSFCCRERGVVDPPMPSYGGADTHPPSQPDPSRPSLPAL